MIRVFEDLIQLIKYPLSALNTAYEDIFYNFKKIQKRNSFLYFLSTDELTAKSYFELSSAQMDSYYTILCGYLHPQGQTVSTCSQEVFCSNIIITTTLTITNFDSFKLGFVRSESKLSVLPAVSPE